jgi:hypothetical protein
MVASIFLASANLANPNEQFLGSEHHETESRSQEDTENNGKQQRPTL